MMTQPRTIRANAFGYVTSKTAIGLALLSAP